jgi:hypothetical protein
MGSGLTLPSVSAWAGGYPTKNVGAGHLGCESLKG